MGAAASAQQSDDAVALQLAQEHLTKENCEPAKLQGVEQGPMPKQALYDATELFLCGGDTHTIPITSLDGQVIGDGNDPNYNGYTCPPKYKYCNGRGSQGHCCDINPDCTCDSAA